MLAYRGRLSMRAAPREAGSLVTMKTRLRWCGILTMLLMVIGRPLPVSAQEPDAASPKANGVDINSQAPANGPPSSPRAPGSVAKITAAMSSVSPAVAEILRMHAAGVDPQVIQAYVEHSGKPFNPTAAEIVSLHENGISDALIASLTQKAAQARQAAGPPAPAAVAAAPVQPPPAMAYPEDPRYGYSPPYTYPAAA